MYFIITTRVLMPQQLLQATISYFMFFVCIDLSYFSNNKQVGTYYVSNCGGNDSWSLVCTGVPTHASYTGA